MLDSDGVSATLAVTVKVTGLDEMPDVSSSSADCKETAGQDGLRGLPTQCGERDWPGGDVHGDGPGGGPGFVGPGPENAAGIVHGADFELFRISKDGVLTFKTSPDFEAATAVDNEHVVIVRATDDAYDITVRRWPPLAPARPSQRR